MPPRHSPQLNSTDIERELLAVVFGCTRFHTYIYAKPVEVESDYKMLEMISLKNLTAAPSRLQRMLLQLQGYDLTIRYRPGKEMILPDGLSRLSNTENNKPIQLDIKVHFVQFSSEKIPKLKKETGRDPQLASLKTKTTAITTPALLGIPG